MLFINLLSLNPQQKATTSTSALSFPAETMFQRQVFEGYHPCKPCSALRCLLVGASLSPVWSVFEGIGGGGGGGGRSLQEDHQRIGRSRRRRRRSLQGSKRNKLFNDSAILHCYCCCFKKLIVLQGLADLDLLVGRGDHRHLPRIASRDRCLAM